jgi:homoserine kinase type II
LPLDGGTADEQAAMGRTLAQAHSVLRTTAIPGAQPFHLDVDAHHLGQRHWLRPAVRDAVADIDALEGRLTTGLVHGDPAPEAFLRDTDGQVGLIDWAAIAAGPLLYDVASAVMYLGGPAQAQAFLTAYAASRLVPEQELRTQLRPMLRFRWAVQADYFARRIAAGDLTGVAGAHDNENGLADARRALTAD